MSPFEIIEFITFLRRYAELRRSMNTRGVDFWWSIPVQKGSQKEPNQVFYSEISFCCQGLAYSCEPQSTQKRYAELIDIDECAGVRLLVEHVLIHLDGLLVHAPQPLFREHVQLRHTYSRIHFASTFEIVDSLFQKS